MTWDSYRLFAKKVQLTCQILPKNNGVFQWKVRRSKDDQKPCPWVWVVFHWSILLLEHKVKPHLCVLKTAGLPRLRVELLWLFGIGRGLLGMRECSILLQVHWRKTAKHIIESKCTHQNPIKQKWIQLFDLVSCNYQAWCTFYLVWFAVSGFQEVRIANSQIIVDTLSWRKSYKSSSWKW